jgi:hypothetical protein
MLWEAENQFSLTRAALSKGGRPKSKFLSVLDNKRLWGWAHCGVLAGCMVWSSAVGAVYYVATGGNDSSQGTEVNPWRTLQKAADTMVAGDTVYVKSGTYQGTVVPMKSGKPGAPITYAAYPGHDVCLDGMDTQTRIIVIPSGMDIRHVVFRGFTVQRATKYGILINDGTDLLFDNLVVRSNGWNPNILPTDRARAGALVNAATNVTFQGGSYSWNGNWNWSTDSQRGIYVLGSSTNVVINNIKASYNANDGVAFHASSGSSVVRNNSLLGCQIFGNQRQGLVTFRVDGLLVQGNNIFSNGATGIQLEISTTNAFVRGNSISSNSWRFGSETGIWLDETVYSVVESNRLEGNYRPLYISQAHYNIWRFNQVYNNKSQLSSATPHYCGTLIAGRGMHPDHPVPAGSRYNYWVHNVFYDNGVAGAERGGWFVSSSSDLSNNVWMNNIVAMTAGKHEANVYGSAPLSRCDHNLYYNSRALQFVFGSTVYDWAGWKKVTGWDANSVAGDPRFANAGGRDFAIGSSSPAVDGGGWLTFTRSAGSGTSIPVQDPSAFSAGLAALGVAGDLVQLQNSSQVAEVVAVDRANRLIRVDRSLNWGNGQGLAYAYANSAPDIGAFEVGSSQAGVGGALEAGDDPDSGMDCAAVGPGDKEECGQYVAPLGKRGTTKTKGQDYGLSPAS